MNQKTIEYYSKLNNDDALPLTNGDNKLIVIGCNYNTRW